MNRWCCVPYAFACATGEDYDEIIKLIGHDGSALMDNQPEPYCRKGFHVQEVIEALWKLHWAVTEFDAIIRPVSEGRPRESEKRNVLQYMWGQPGVITGLFDGKPHASAWDGYQTEESCVDLIVHSFYAVTRRPCPESLTFGQ